jgi:hypothetical protein
VDVVSDRQRIRRHASNGTGRGTIVAPDTGLPRINPKAAAIRSHIADLEEQLIAMAAADLKAATPAQAQRVFDDPEYATEGTVDDHVRYYVYRHYAEGADETPAFVDRLSDALDEVPNQGWGAISLGAD